MRTQQLALAAALAAAVFSANAASGRTEPVNSPFTYEVLNATPSLTFGRAAPAKAVEAPKAAAVVPAAEAPKPVAASANKPAAPTRAANTSSPFTYDGLGATPHIDLKKQPAKREAQAPSAAE